MKITNDTQLWVVLDPTPVSELIDIFFEATLDDLQNHMIGSALGRKESPSDRNMTIYTDRVKAEMDAEQRLVERKK